MACQVNNTEDIPDTITIEGSLYYIGIFSLCANQSNMDESALLQYIALKVYFENTNSKKEGFIFYDVYSNHTRLVEVILMHLLDEKLTRTNLTHVLYITHQM